MIDRSCVRIVPGQVVPCQCLMVRVVARLAVAKKYGIKEDVVNATILSCCCSCCADAQTQNEIMKQENLNHGCAQVYRATPPASVEMERS